MLTAAYSNKRLFSISMLPSDARWGRRTDFENKERVLCDPASNKPYLVWLVGRVSFAWFVERGEYAEKPNITIIPVDVGDATLTASWLTRLAKPARGGVPSIGTKLVAYKLNFHSRCSRESSGC